VKTVTNVADNVVEFPQLNDPKIAESVRKGLQDISNQMTMIEGYRSAIKAAIDALSEEFDLPKKLIRQMSRTYHRQTFETEVQEKDAFEQTYEKVFGSDG
jgi:hypothetical protein